MSATTSSGASNPHTIEVVARRELFRGRVDSPTLFGAENGFSVILNSVGRPTEGFYDTALTKRTIFEVVEIVPRSARVAKVGRPSVKTMLADPVRRERDVVVVFSIHMQVDGDGLA